MNVLLDTHIAIWAAAGDAKLSNKAIDIIEDANNTLYVSVAAIQEIAIKHGRGNLDIHPRQARAAFKAAGFVELPVTGDHAEMVSVLPQFTDHADPFDRMMVAQALSESMHLMTADTKLPRYHSSLIIQA
jgi:PIN domain nuclease of toxin-antitoxin system